MMPFSDEQFGSFMEKMVDLKETRELLIRIDENTKNSQKQFTEHVILNSNIVSDVKKIAEDAHNRIDTISDDQKKVKNITIGVCMVIGLLFTIINFILNAYSTIAANREVKYVRIESQGEGREVRVSDTGAGQVVVSR